MLPDSRLLIGCAAGFSGDRVDAAGPVVDTLIARGGPAFLIFETLAERTLALAQLARRQNPDAGYEPQLDAMLRPVLARCLTHGIRIVSNFGAANPRGAARKILALARELGLPAPRIAIVTGDDLSGAQFRPLLLEYLGASGRGSSGAKAGVCANPAIGPAPCPEQEAGKATTRGNSAFAAMLAATDSIVSANAYLGGEPIAAALLAGAQIVVAGRVADPSLAVGPALAHFGWRPDDWDRLGRATMAGHLLECGTQVTGGYFADPGYKDVSGMHNLGFPIAEIDADGHCVIGKAERTGGLVSLQTVKEQLLYEVHDPAAYITPDVVADIAEAEVRMAGSDRVALLGVRGHPRTDSLKVTVYHEGGWLAEGEISYGGARAERRARLAADTLRRRLEGIHLRIDLIGVISVFGDDAGGALADILPSVTRDARDVRLRVAATHQDKAVAERVAAEVTALYTCGPAGGGGVRTALRTRLNTLSCLIPRAAVTAGFEMVE